MAAGGGKLRKKRSFTLRLQNEHEEMEIYEDTLLKASEKFN